MKNTYKLAEMGKHRIWWISYGTTAYTKKKKKHNHRQLNQKSDFRLIYNREILANKIDTIPPMQRKHNIHIYRQIDTYTITDIF